jgi:hypothetical protein
MTDFLPFHECHSKFRTGLKPTPKHKLAEALLAGWLKLHKPVGAPPAQGGLLTPPKTLSMEGNDQYGDCVSAEAAAAIEAWSTYCGPSEIVIPDANCISFARQNGFLNGADLLEVCQAMQSQGMMDSAGTVRKEGPATLLDCTNEAALQSALCIGPVKYSMASSGLPSGAGNQSGWTAFGAGRNQGEDHCMGFWAYGPASVICPAYGMPVPSGVSPTTTIYVTYTWSTFGFVDIAWIRSITSGEAYSRNPTTVGVTPSPTPTPTPPTPTPPTPTPTPTPGMLTLPATLTIQPDGTWTQNGTVLGPDTLALLKRDLGIGDNKDVKGFLLQFAQAQAMAISKLSQELIP